MLKSLDHGWSDSLDCLHALFDQKPTQQTENRFGSARLISPWLKLIVYGLKAQFMNSSRKMLGESSFFLNERLVDEQLGRSREQLHGSPFLYLLLQGSEVSLHPVDTNRQLSSREKCFECFAKTGVNSP
jgi:hypothetical protein